LPSNSKKKVLFVFPTAWDRRQLDACRPRWDEQFEILFADPSDAECPYDFDILGFIEETAARYRGRIAGVTSSSDYPGATVAGAISTRLGLPGSPPETIIRCSHKYYSRLAQREAAPEATPGFQLVDPRKPLEEQGPFPFPLFVKPVKGAFSVLARRIDGLPELREFLSHPATQEFISHYMRVFNKLVAGVTHLEINGCYFIAEELLRGVQTTVEGFASGGEVEILGIVDSVLHPGSNSFAQFIYPSSLSAVILQRMAEIARRVMLHLGLANTLFNIEMIYDASRDAIRIIEINPRLCGQFADLYEKVDGTNGYEVALALATGGRRRLKKGSGGYSIAASVPLRVFDPVEVNRAPRREDVRAAEALFPGTLVWPECETGQELADFAWFEDGQSARYGIINLGADDPASLAARLDQVKTQLGFRFSPLAR